jgi:DNA-binding IclR family transcriptional regulator
MAKATADFLVKFGNLLLSNLPAHSQGWFVSSRQLGMRLSKHILGSVSARSAKIHRCLVVLEKMGFVERRNSKPIGWRRTEAGTEHLDRINGWVR